VSDDWDDPEAGQRTEWSYVIEDDHESWVTEMPVFKTEAEAKDRASTHGGGRTFRREVTVSRWVQVEVVPARKDDDV
jgi:hypothetical protein